MIQIKSLDKSVSQGNGRLFILRQVSVDIAAGEFVTSSKLAVGTRFV